MVKMDSPVSNKTIHFKLIKCYEEIKYTSIYLFVCWGLTSL